MSDGVLVLLRVVGVLASLALLVHPGPRLYVGSVLIALGSIGLGVSLLSLAEDGAATMAWFCAVAVVVGAVLVASGLRSAGVRASSPDPPA
ncbi:MAG: hypothetical protein KF906_03670 [Actinobacteria bacterium]|nr:hypothetical protein [Actinomycetota bacterium]